MKLTKEEERHFVAGCYTCPQTKTEVQLEADVPRPWVEWPMRVQCKSCGKEHVLEYDDVRQCGGPTFGRE